MALYKLARQVPEINFEDYISCQEDLDIIIESLPAQQYIGLFNKFDSNYHTMQIKEAILDRTGERSQLSTFI